MTMLLLGVFLVFAVGLIGWGISTLYAAKKEEDRLPQSLSQNSAAVLTPEVKSADYYVTRGKKIGDFLIGFFGCYVLNTLIPSLFFVVFNIFRNSEFGRWGMDVAGFSVTVLTLGLNIASVIYFFKIQRRFIAIGIIGAVVLLLLLVGGCFAVWAGSMGSGLGR